MVSVSKPGLLIPDLEFGSLAIFPERSLSNLQRLNLLTIDTDARATALRGAWKLPQQLLQRQRAVDGSQPQSPQLVDTIQQQQQYCNIHVRSRFWQVRATAQFRRLARRAHGAIDARCDPGLKAGQAQPQCIGAGPALSGRRNVPPPPKRSAQSTGGLGLELCHCGSLALQRLEWRVPQHLQHRGPRATA